MENFTVDSKSILRFQIEILNQNKKQLKLRNQYMDLIATEVSRKSRMEQ